MAKILLISGITSAACASFFTCLFFLVRRKLAVRKERFHKLLGSGDILASASVNLEVSGVWKRLISMLIFRTKAPQSFLFGSFEKLWLLGLGSADQLIKQAGLNGQVSILGIANVRRFLSLSFAAVGFLLGFLFSDLLAFVLLITGFVLGYVLPLLALKQERQARTDAVERDLARMLEVIVLGLRGGLSFDQSLSYYSEYFTGGLSASVSLAQTQWSFGLLSREEALLELVGSFGSQLLREAVESINRSLRYGISLADDLSDLALSARTRRKARLEEQVAKAPVKMLLPVGTLILPAMLILVVGPILLDLMNRF